MDVRGSWRTCGMKNGPQDIGFYQNLMNCCWFLENPDSGYLKTRPCVQGLPYVRVDYCMYQNPPLYRKRARIWTNGTDWSPKLCDRSHLVDGKHPASAQRGYRKDDRRSGERTFTRYELHRLPRALCNDFFGCVKRPFFQ